MNQKDSLTLQSQGRDAWNEWAKSMLAERSRLEATGQWQMASGEMTRAAQKWAVAATANFAEYTFDFKSDFGGFVFPSEANYSKAIFSSEVSFNEAVFFGYARFDRVEFGGEAKFEAAQFSASTWFGGCKFCDHTSFRACEFSETAIFTSAVFEHLALFEDAKFSSEAQFDWVIFSDGGHFGRAKFIGNAEFRWAKFSRVSILSDASFSGTSSFWQAEFGDVAFDDVIFSRDANFSQVTFQGLARFKGSKFENEAEFIAMKGEGSFSLENATFLQIPNFEQAHFAEAPRFDNVDVHRPVPRSAKAGLAARWRTLKRLAVQAHDHEREQIFFAEEIKALRGFHDHLLPNPRNLFREGKKLWPGGTRYWIGLGYQAFSDFGRSMLRPILWWIGAMPIFALYYLSRHFAAPPTNYPTGTLGWLWRAAASWLFLAPAPPALVCRDSQGEPWAAALYLAVHNGSLVAGLGGAEKLRQTYLCLYGIATASSGAPVIPDAVVYVGLFQTIFSAILVFLFLLAVRNHFRIK